MNKVIKEKKAQTFVAPLHMRGADTIAQMFRVHRRTVIGWQKKGAPIVCVGRAYVAEYNALMFWLCAQDD